MTLVLAGGVYLLGRDDTIRLFTLRSIWIPLVWFAFGLIVNYPDYAIRRDERLITTLGPMTMEKGMGFVVIYALLALLVRFAQPYMNVGQSAEAWFAGTCLMNLSWQSPQALWLFGRISGRAS